MSYYFKFLAFIGVIVILLAAGIFFFMRTKDRDLELLIYELAEAANRGDSAAICAHIPDNYNHNGYDGKRMKDLVTNYLNGVVEKVQIKKMDQSNSGTFIRVDIEMEVTFSSKSMPVSQFRSQPMLVSIRWENREGTWFITAVDTNQQRK